jgi:putative nucleotidyltransferase with HDIG domain
MFLSIKKCFWKEGRSKIFLFLISVVIYPLLWFFISQLTSGGLIGSYFQFVKEYNDYLSNALVVAAISALGALLFLVAISVCTFIGLLWLKFENISAFVFLYVMHTALFVTNIRSAVKNGELFSIPNLGSIFNIFTSIFLYIAAWAFYRVVVTRFSELVKEKTIINWKLFVIPPLAISLIFSSVAMSMNLKNSSDGIKVLNSAFSLIIILVFVWAFYVIIKNMMATNEAIKAKDEIKTLSVEVMEALAHTIDAKDEYTKGHSVRVAKYSRMLAERLGLSDEDCESVYYMALLHDIGKIGVPNEIINGKSKMTDEEYAVMKTHPVVGSDILSEIQSRPDLMIGARWHHERYDGKGYPDGKAGEDIPYFARIISVADSYDAMTSNRSYRKFLPQDVVRSEIEKNCGTQFDPNIAKCMISVIDEDVNYEYHE